MSTIADFLARLSEEERLELITALDAGLHGAQHASLCLTDQDTQQQDTTQLLAYLSHAVTELSEALDFIKQRLEG